MNITEQIEKFRAALENMLVQHRAEHFPNSTLPMPSVEISIGKTFARIIKVDGSSRSAYGFIDLKNGDLLKAASWKAPALHARGNIFADDMLAGCGPYGMAYLR
jgi:hypothetical protein